MKKFHRWYCQSARWRHTVQQRIIPGSWTTWTSALRSTMTQARYVNHEIKTADEESSR